MIYVIVSHFLNYLYEGIMADNFSFLRVGITNVIQKNHKSYIL